MPTNKGYLTAKSTKESDEYYTPAYAVKPPLKYLERYCNKLQYTIWCPFDKAESQFVKVFKDAGYKVIHSHIDEDKDFLLMSLMSLMILLSQIRLSLVKMKF